MVYPILKIGRDKKDEINLKTDNFILISGNKNTGKSWLAIDLINKVINQDNAKEIVLVSWQDRKIYTKKSMNHSIDLIEYFKEVKDNIINDEGKFEEEKQNIYYIDGIHLSTKEEKDLFKEILNSIRFSSYNFIVTTRDNIEDFNPDLIINTAVKNDYNIISVKHQSVLYDSPVVKIIEKEDFDLKSHFKLIEGIFNTSKI